jgi:branched-chain amino acid transport system substrate-binding protein
LTMQISPVQLSVLVLLCLSVAACSKQESKEPEPFVVEVGAPEITDAPSVDIERQLLIGIVGPETGPQARYGEAVYQGALLAVQRSNDNGGIEGQDIQLLHYDNEGDAGLTMDIVQYFVGQRAMAIITAPTGWATFGPTHITDDSSTILISIGSRRRIARSGDYIFQMSLSDEIATDYMISYTIREMGFKRFALISVSDYDYSLDLSASFKKALNRHGAELLVDVDIYDTYTGQHNIEAIIPEILSRADSLDAVVFTGNARDAANLARSLRDENVHLPLLAGEDLYSDEFLTDAGQAAIGSLVYATYPNKHLVQAANFITKFQNQYEDPPDRFAALAFDATTLLVKAIRESGSRHSSVVREAFLKSKLTEGVTGSSEFSEQGSSIKVPLIFKVVAGQDAGAERFALQNRP